MAMNAWLSSISIRHSSRTMWMSGVAMTDTTEMRWLCVWMYIKVSARGTFLPNGNSYHRTIWLRWLRLLRQWRKRVPLLNQFLMCSVFPVSHNAFLINQHVLEALAGYFRSRIHGRDIAAMNFQFIAPVWADNSRMYAVFFARLPDEITAEKDSAELCRDKIRIRQIAGHWSLYSG